MRAEFINRYLNKLPKDLEWDDLRRFVAEGIEENLTLEYKPRGLLVDTNGAPIKPKNRNEVVGFAQLAKLVAGFANSAGGLLVLGVKEKPERYKGQVVKIRPGSFSEIPPTITREMIEHNLEAKIQVSIDELTIVPIRKTPNSKNCVFLIDVPPSVRAPHRVNELFYYQRHNFSTVEMQHYQIADMFGRRMRPDLEIAVTDISNKITAPENKQKTRSVRVTFLVINAGRAVAKYVTCLCTVLEGGDSIAGGHGWISHDGRKIVQYETKLDRVIYPDIPLGAGTLTVHANLQPQDTGDGPVRLKFQLYAEDMPGKWIEMTIDPAQRSISNYTRGNY